MVEPHPKDHSLLGLAIVSIGLGVVLMIVSAGLLYVVDSVYPLQFAGAGPRPGAIPQMRAEHTGNRRFVGGIAVAGALLTRIGFWFWRLYRRRQRTAG